MNIGNSPDQEKPTCAEKDLKADLFRSILQEATRLAPLSIFQRKIKQFAHLRGRGKRLSI